MCVVISNAPLKKLIRLLVIHAELIWVGVELDGRVDRFPNGHDTIDSLFVRNGSGSRFLDGVGKLLVV